MKLQIKREVQCINIAGSKPHLASCNDKKSLGYYYKLTFATYYYQNRKIHVFVNYMKTNRTNLIKLPEH